VVSSYEEGYETVGAVIVTGWKLKKYWVLDSGCSYHICLRNEVGVVSLGDIFVFVICICIYSFTSFYIDAIKNKNMSHIR